MMDRLRVGTFEIYPSERMLCSGGKPLDVGARAFDLLLVLVEHQGRLVTKGTLLERVWPRLVVDENNLPAQIASLRRILGAGAIRTIPGYGYRLELPVSSSATNQQAPEAPPALAPPGTIEAPRLSVPRRAWPNRLGPLIGREAELRDLQRAIKQSCLVTIVGSAGVGKSRIAQEILALESEKTGTSVAWVPLQPLSDAQHIPSAIALALGISLPDKVDGFLALRQALEQIPILLILDAVEQFSESLPVPLAELVLHTQGVRALVTSQVPLGVPGETVYRLSALPVPERGTPQRDAARFAAIELFADRAAAADRRFELSTANTPIVAEICRRLDGNPLALELAAARIPALGINALLERLDDRFRLLRNPGRSPDPRHGALIAAFDWSFGLLTAAEQTVFRRLGTFAGSFSLQAAARCAADETIDIAEAIDLIGRLVDRSLVTALPTDPPRYALVETARYFATDRLAAAGELHSAQERMARTMLSLLDAAYQEYWSLDEAIWLHRYEPELDNVRAAFDWATTNDRALGVSLYGSAWPLFVETDLYPEGRNRFAQAVTLLSDALPRDRTGRFWEAVATYDSTRQCDRARYAAELAAAMFTATGDARSHYYALVQLAFNWRGDDAAARVAFDAAQAIEDPGWPARLLTLGALTEGALLMSSGQFVDARLAYRRAVKLALTVSERLAFFATVHIVELDTACGDTASALQLGRPLAVSLRHSGRRESRFELLVMTFSALLIAGEFDEARATGAELFDLAQRLDTSKLYLVLDAMAFLACAEGRHEVAARIAVFSDLAHEAHGQARRRPTEEQMRAGVARALDDGLGPQWRRRAAEAREKLDEAAACSLALGLLE